MSKRTRTTFLILLLVVVALAICGCDDWGMDDEARRQWQAEVNSRQRQPGQSATIETPEVAEGTE